MLDQIKSLEKVINERKNRVTNVHSQIQLVMKRNEQETLVFLEPILEILKDMQKRLEVVEKLNKNVEK
jgi:hypothetical protein